MFNVDGRDVVMALVEKNAKCNILSRRTQVQRYQDAPDTKKKSGVMIMLPGEPREFSDWR